MRFDTPTGVAETNFPVLKNGEPLPGTGVPTFDPAYEQAVVAALVSVALAQQAWPGGGSPTM